MEDLPIAQEIQSSQESISVDTPVGDHYLAPFCRGDIRSVLDGDHVLQRVLNCPISRTRLNDRLVHSRAEFMKNNNAPIKVVGYADKKTGTSDYNMGLSEKRARAVAKELIDKYGISSSQITIEWRGSDETMSLLARAKKKGMPFFVTPYYLSLLNIEHEGYDDTTAINKSLNIH